MTGTDISPLRHEALVSLQEGEKTEKRPFPPQTSEENFLYHDMTRAATRAKGQKYPNGTKRFSVGLESTRSPLCHPEAHTATLSISTPEASKVPSVYLEDRECQGELRGGAMSNMHAT